MLARTCVKSAIARDVMLAPRIRSWAAGLFDNVSRIARNPRVCNRPSSIYEFASWKIAAIILLSRMGGVMGGGSTDGISSW